LFATISTFSLALLLLATPPLSERQGGTGSGSLTCSAGDFITSNGTSYSCATPSAGGYTLPPITASALGGIKGCTGVGCVSSPGITCAGGYVVGGYDAAGVIQCVASSAPSYPITYDKGGTGQTTAPDDNILVGTGTAWGLVSIPNVTAGSFLTYSTASNSFSTASNSTTSTTASNFSGNYVASVATTAPVAGGVAPGNAVAITLSMPAAGVGQSGYVSASSQTLDGAKTLNTSPITMGSASGGTFSISTPTGSSGANSPGGNLTTICGNGSASDGSATSATGGYQWIYAGNGGASSGTKAGAVGGYVQVTGGTGGVGNASALSGAGGPIGIAGGAAGTNSLAASCTSGGDVQVVGGAASNNGGSITHGSSCHHGVITLGNATTDSVQTVPMINAKGGISIGSDDTQLNTQVDKSVAYSIPYGKAAGTIGWSLASTSANQILHGNGAGAPTWTGIAVGDFVANQGTTTQALHGNASGQPSWANTSNVVFITTDRSTTSTTAATTTDLTWAIAANASQTFNCNFATINTATSLTRFAVAGPTSMTTVSCEFNYHSISLTTMPSAALQAQWATTCTNCTPSVTASVLTTVLPMRFTCTVLNGSTAGSITIYFASSTSGQTNTIKKGSACVWWTT
jgi:hypothetical protein